MMFLSRLLLAVATLMTLAGCGFTKSRESAERAVELFHEQYNHGRFPAIYHGTTEGFRTTSTEPTFLQFMAGVRNRFGSVKSSSPKGWRVNAGPSGKFLELSYSTQFERGAATELFTFALSGEDVRLHGYNVTSPDVPTGTSGATATVGFSPVDEAQREAVRRYPELGRAGSPLNREFVARHKRLQQDNPAALKDSSWPLRLAEEAAKAVGSR